MEKSDIIITINLLFVKTEKTEYIKEKERKAQKSKYTSTTNIIK